jgi:hypothetical protein
MTILEKFNRRVVELIHGKPYDEAIKIQRENYNPAPITIGRVMQALENHQTGGNEAGDECAYAYAITGNGYFFQILPKFRCESLNIHWKLTEKLGREAESEDQTEETLSQLLNLLTKIK